MVHQLRSEMAGVIVGIGTVLADDPMLNVRLDGDHHQPARIVVDSNLRIPIDNQLVTTAKDYRTIVCRDAARHVPTGTIVALQNEGVEIIDCQSNNNHIDINDLMTKLGAMGIDSLLLEGGGTINAAFLEAGCVDEVWTFIAPKIIGGESAKTSVLGRGIERMSDAIQLQNIDIQNINGDILIKGKICSRE